MIIVGIVLANLSIKGVLESIRDLEEALGSIRKLKGVFMGRMNLL